MGMNMTKKILKEHLVKGRLRAGEEAAVRVDQVLTQDATGTMAYLQFEAMGIDRVQCLAVSYVDHNMLQTGFENPDDHRYLQSAAAKFGAYFSRPGNGICHQVHLERFGVPGAIQLGSDSHTPTGGGLGALAMGAGGLDVAVAMGGGPYYITVPRVVGVKLVGELRPWVAAKDIILEMLRRLSVKGGVGKIFEYFGPGVESLSVPERATITNMGAELGATTSLFPSDSVTKRFLKAQGRAGQYRSLKPSKSASYDEEIEIDLDALEPLVAKPHSPDNVVPVREVEGLRADQVCVGSCTNSSYYDLTIVAEVLKGKTVAPNLNMTVSPGSKQVYEMAARDGAIAAMIAAGARILESACGPCIGMGQAPPSGGVSVRTFNRNFVGRSGTADAQVYLASPETAAATALRGAITDPRSLGEKPAVKTPRKFLLNDNLILPPADPESAAKVEIVRGPNIKPVPLKGSMPDELAGEVLLKVGDNISTDHILPAGSKILPLRSNIPAISEYVFTRVDESFPARAREKGGGFVVGGENYGQGSSREHAALAPSYLGLKAVLVKSFARIHFNNLINFGILPLTFAKADDYEKIEQGDSLEILSVPSCLAAGDLIEVKNRTKGAAVRARLALTGRQRAILKAGGLLPYTKAGGK
ncbi:MAG: aconitate hydratase [Acidobacteriota bacterium]|nr:MAG: aconitate hydratase [Acidobacteriota bacterium]